MDGEQSELDWLDKILENYSLNILGLAKNVLETGQLKPIVDVTKLRLEAKSAIKAHLEAARREAYIEGYAAGVKSSDDANKKMDEVDANLSNKQEGGE